MSSEARLQSVTIARYMERKGLRGEELEKFLSPRLAHLSSPSCMADRERAAQRLAQAIRAGERIALFGDYDCDGMTATAILTEALRELGAREVRPFLASRFEGGYGLSARALERVLAFEPHLLVTCDCGSSDHESLREVRARGIDAIVVDHHLVPDEPLPVLAFLNPHRPECEFAYKGLASCGLALSVAAAVRAELGVALDVRKWLDLVAIGTIADVAPLDGDNRALVRAGLLHLARTERPGLRALFSLMKLDAEAGLNAADVAFRIAPRLNAPGRLGSAEPALELLLEREEKQAELCAEKVEQLCQKRREDQKLIEEEAEREAAPLLAREASALVIGRAGWNPGIVGIVAGRLADKYERPVIVVGFEGTVGRGSVRGPQGFPLFDALAEASAALVRFGGHQAAAGLELTREKWDEFCELFERACASRSAAQPALSTEAVLEMDEADEPAAILEDLKLLEPCGAENPEPRLALVAEVQTARAVRGGHLKLDLVLRGGQRLSAFGPNLGVEAEPLRGQVRVVGQLRADRYRGGDAVEMLVQQVEMLSSSEESAKNTAV